MSSVTSSTSDGGASAALRRSVASAYMPPPPPPREAPISSETARADDPPAVVVTLTKSFGEMVTKRSADFGAELTQAFETAGISAAEPVALTLDRVAGTVSAEGPDKERIEALFSDRPDLTEGLKSVATLNALDAMQEANRLSENERRVASTREEANAARDRHTARSFEIQALSSGLTLKDGRIHSAAMEFIRTVG
jgi:hypothetical protein